MKLIYTIPNKLWWMTNFLDYSTYKGIHGAIVRERKKINLHTSKGIWADSLINNHTPPLRTSVSNYPPFEKLKTLIKSNPYIKINDIQSMKTNINYMNKSSGINWHDDGGWKYGATYYVNRRWNIHWGGEFMFADDAAHGFLPITGNSLVIVKAPLYHKVNPVLSPVMPRISVQIFMK